MVGVNSPDISCGQILFGLKMSRLNYMVQETPYSMFVTIRKKFIKDTGENTNPAVEVLRPSDKDVELFTLKQRNKELETQLALAKFDHGNQD